MIKLKWNFPNFHTKRKGPILDKMRKYGLHTSEVLLLEEEGIF